MKYTTIAACVAAGLWTSIGQSQPATRSETDELRAELESLRTRLDELDSSQGAGDRLKISGDLRYRHEYIDDADATTDRNRQRIRARLDIDATLSDDLEVGFALATGGGNPVSANQTLDGGFSRKDIGFDRAYFAWSASDDVTLTGGKMGNPLFRPGGYHLIFDSDLNPEGLALGYDAEHVFATVAGLWVDERGSGDDAILYALQGGFKRMIGRDKELTVGASYLDYDNTKGYEPFYLGEPQGNTVDANGNLINDYKLVELFAQLQLMAGNEPLSLFVDLVRNTGADNYDTGSAIGARWRRATEPGSWDVTWAYEDLEADAVIATFTDSDFNGGGTDGKGHVVKGSYVLRDNVTLNGTYFINKIGQAAGNERDYNRLQLDINFKF